MGDQKVGTLLLEIQATLGGLQANMKSAVDTVVTAVDKMVNAQEKSADAVKKIMADSQEYINKVTMDAIQYRIKLADQQYQHDRKLIEDSKADAETQAAALIAIHQVKETRIQEIQELAINKRASMTMRAEGLISDANKVANEQRARFAEVTAQRILDAEAAVAQKRQEAETLMANIIEAANDRINKATMSGTDYRITVIKSEYEKRNNIIRSSDAELDHQNMAFAANKKAMDAEISKVIQDSTTKNIKSIRSVIPAYGDASEAAKEASNAQIRAAGLANDANKIANDQRARFSAAQISQAQAAEAAERQSIGRISDANKVANDQRLRFAAIRQQAEAAAAAVSAAAWKASLDAVKAAEDAERQAIGRINDANKIANDQRLRFAAIRTQQIEATKKAEIDATNAVEVAQRMAVGRINDANKIANEQRARIADTIAKAEQAAAKVVSDANDAMVGIISASQDKINRVVMTAADYRRTLVQKEYEDTKKLIDDSEANEFVKQAAHVANYRSMQAQMTDIANSESSKQAAATKKAFGPLEDVPSIAQRASNALQTMAAVGQSIMGLNIVFSKLEHWIGSVNELLIRHNAEWQNTNIAIASIVYATQKFTSATGESLHGMEAFNVAQRAANELMEKFQVDQISTVNTSQELSRSAAILSSMVLGAGKNMDDLRKVTMAAAVGASALSLPLQQVTYEMNELFAGRVLISSPLVQRLHLTADELQRLKEGGAGAIDALMENMQRFTIAADAHQKSWDGITTAIRDAEEIFTRIAGTSIFQKMASDLSGLVDQIFVLTNGVRIFNPEIEKVALVVGDNLANAYKAVKDTLDPFINTLVGATKFVYEHGNAFKSLAYSVGAAITALFGLKVVSQAADWFMTLQGAMELVRLSYNASTAAAAANVIATRVAAAAAAEQALAESAAAAASGVKTAATTVGTTTTYAATTATYAATSATYLEITAMEADAAAKEADTVATAEFTVAEDAAAVSTGLVSGALIIATGAAETFAAAIAMAGLAGPILLFASLAGAVHFAFLKYDELNTAQERDLVNQGREAHALVETAKATDDSYKSFMKLVEEYDKVNASTMDAAIKSDRLNQILDAMKRLHPELADAIDKSTGAVNRASGAVFNYGEQWRKAGQEALNAARNFYTAEKANLASQQSKLDSMKAEAAKPVNGALEKVGVGGGLFGGLFGTGDAPGSSRSEQLALQIKAQSKLVEDGMAILVKGAADLNQIGIAFHPDSYKPVMGGVGVETYMSARAEEKNVRYARAKAADIEAKYDLGLGGDGAKGLELQGKRIQALKDEVQGFKDLAAQLPKTGEAADLVNKKLGLASKKLTDKSGAFQNAEDKSLVDAVESAYRHENATATGGTKDVKNQKIENLKEEIANYEALRTKVSEDGAALLDRKIDAAKTQLITATNQVEDAQARAGASEAKREEAAARRAETAAEKAHRLQRDVIVNDFQEKINMTPENDTQKRITLMADEIAALSQFRDAHRLTADVYTKDNEVINASAGKLGEEVNKQAKKDEEDAKKIFAAETTLGDDLEKMDGEKHENRIATATKKYDDMVTLFKSYKDRMISEGTATAEKLQRLDSDIETALSAKEAAINKVTITDEMSALKTDLDNSLKMAKKDTAGRMIDLDTYIAKLKESEKVHAKTAEDIILYEAAITKASAERTAEVIKYNEEFTKWGEELRKADEETDKYNVKLFDDIQKKVTDISKVYDSLTSSSKSTWDKILELGTGFVNEFKVPIANALSPLTDAFSDIFKGATPWVKDLTQDIQGLVSNLVNQASALWIVGNNWVIAGVKAAASWIAQLGPIAWIIAGLAAVAAGIIAIIYLVNASNDAAMAMFSSYNSGLAMITKGASDARIAIEAMNQAAAQGAITATDAITKKIEVIKKERQTAQDAITSPGGSVEAAISNMDFMKDAYKVADQRHKAGDFGSLVFTGKSGMLNDPNGIPNGATDEQITDAAARSLIDYGFDVSKGAKYTDADMARGGILLQLFLAGQNKRDAVNNQGILDNTVDPLNDLVDKKGSTDMSNTRAALSAGVIDQTEANKRLTTSLGDLKTHWTSMWESATNQTQKNVAKQHLDDINQQLALLGTTATTSGRSLAQLQADAATEMDSWNTSNVDELGNFITKAQQHKVDLDNLVASHNQKMGTTQNNRNAENGGWEQGQYTNSEGVTVVTRQDEAGNPISRDLQKQNDLTAELTRHTAALDQMTEQRASTQASLTASVEAEADSIDKIMNEGIAQRELSVTQDKLNRIADIKTAAAAQQAGYQKTLDGISDQMVKENTAYNTKILNIDNTYNREYAAHLKTMSNLDAQDAAEDLLYQHQMLSLNNVWAREQDRHNDVMSNISKEMLAYGAMGAAAASNLSSSSSALPPWQANVMGTYAGPNGLPSTTPHPASQGVGTGTFDWNATNLAQITQAAQQATRSSTPSTNVTPQQASLLSYWGLNPSNVIGSYDVGGTIPGSEGQPSLAVVHGKEEVATSGQVTKTGQLLNYLQSLFSNIGSLSPLASYLTNPSTPGRAGTTNHNTVNITTHVSGNSFPAGFTPTDLMGMVDTQVTRTLRNYGGLSGINTL